jgi:ATP-dependent helicase/nuclease subunit B
LLPLETLKRKCSEKQTGVSFCKVLYQFFMEQQVEKRLSRQLLSIEDMQKRMEQQKEWIFVWNTVMEMLDHIASLYETVELEFSAFSTILSFLICSIERAVPPKTLDAILISDGTSARLNAPKIVFLLGVRDGAFPITPSGSGIFSQRDCSALAALNLSVVKPKEVALADARLDAYKLLSAASQQLYLTYPVVDVSHQKCYPSAVLTQIQRMFPNENSLKQNAKALGCAYYAGTLHAAYYQYVQNFGENTEDTASIESFLQENDFYAKRLQALKSFTGGQNASESEPIYQISNPNLMTEYLGDTLNFSASALERYQKCPFSYFCHDILRLRQRQHIQLSGASGGSLIHYCLEKLLKAYDKESFLQLSETVLFRKVSSYAQEYWNEFMGGNFSKSNRELAIFHHTIQDMLPMLLHLQEELRQSCFVPYQVELVIEPGKADFPPLELFTNEGQRIQMCGKIDRVDLCRDGEKTWVRIIDYKSGEKTFSLGNLQYGLDMQMLIYLFSITAENAALSDAIPAGVLYLPSGKIKKDIKREDKITMTKHWNDTYRMNGLLVKDPALIPLMEREGSGIYIPGTLDENGQIKEDGATFLSLTQMKYLREYVLTQLKHTAEEIYHGTIDAFPLEFENQLCCTYCDYRNVCGSDFCHKRVTEGTKKDRNKRVFETLEQMRQKEENADGVDTTTTGCH